jgi:hypothetical protein
MTKKALFVLSGSAIPASMQASVLILEPNLTISLATDFIGFNPETQTASVGTYPAGKSFGLSYSSSSTSKPTVVVAPGSVGEISYYTTPIQPPGSGTANMAVNFLPLSEVGPASSWLTAVTAANLDKAAVASQFPAGTRGFVGLRSGKGADWNYSWADVSYNLDLSVTLHGFGYETQPNVAIQTVPETRPGIAVAMIAGSLVAWRARQLHRRNRKVASSEHPVAA